jgi:hypothetical protein
MYCFLLEVISTGDGDCMKREILGVSKAVTVGGWRMTLFGAVGLHDQRALS